MTTEDECAINFEYISVPWFEMKILITGVAGMLGSNFSQWILQHHPECEIFGIDNLCTGFKENVDDRVKFYELDLVDHKALEKVFEQNSIDYIVHMAAFAAEGLSDYVRRHTYNSNVIASTNLINCAINHDVKRFFFTSSIASYGELTPPFKEDMTPHPIDVYGLSKYVTEQDLRIAQEHHGLEYVVIKPFNITGPKQAMNSPYRNVLAIFMNRLLDDKTLQIYGDGSQTRAFSYIDDLLTPMWNALTDPKCANQTYNLGSEKKYTVKQLADIVIEVTGRGEIEYLEARHEVKLAWSEVTKAKQELGFEDQTDLKTGVRRFWDYAQNHVRQPTQPFKDIEVTKKMYSFWK